MQEHPVVLFDGVCNFCNGTINFIIRQDKKGVLRFAALQSEAGQQLLKQFGLPKSELGSFVLIENGNVYQRSTAALRLYNNLPWYWKWTNIFWLVPGSVRDGIYNIIARNRYKWFGQKEQCMIPSPDVRNKFL